MRSPALGWLSKYYEYIVAKQNGGGAEWVELFITLTKGMGKPTYGLLLYVSHRVLVFEACSACPASKVLRWMLWSVVRRLSRGKYIILCESRSQRALNGSVLPRDSIPNLATACERCHLVFRFKQKAECNLREKTV